MGDSQKKITDNEFFVTLVQVIKGNDETGKLIRKILEMEPDTRSLFVDNFIMELKKDNNDEKLIEAISYIKNDEIVKEIINFIK